MFKKLREKCKNKKGFTMVELIVVIVIILVLAGAMVPSLMKYVDNAKKANCKADAATLLSQLQADYVSEQADAVDATTAQKDYTLGDVTIKFDATATMPTAKGAAYSVGTDGEINKFVYYDGTKYGATWEQTTGQWEVEKTTTTP